MIEGTIIENVRLGRSWITSDEVRRALVDVGLWDELSRLPDGLHSHLSTHGAPLSKGQAIRLMLARAIAAGPRLLMLDETLDGLDLDSRRQVMRSLFDKSLTGTTTLLIVTHDETIARRCDQVVLLIDGKAENSKGLATALDLGEWLEEVRSCRSA